MIRPIAASGVVFDLDDTLYLESEYVHSGFRAVSRRLAATGVVTYDDALAFLEHSFRTGVRGDTFDRLIQELPDLRDRVVVSNLVDAYRTHTPEIGLQPGISSQLDALRAAGTRIGVISDGPLASQQSKVAALNLEPLFDEIVLTDRWGREHWKPSPRAFEHLAAVWNLPPERLVYIGDNPAKDFLAPNRLGWWTVRLRMPGQLRFRTEHPTTEHAPKRTVSSVEALDEVLRVWVGCS